MSDGALRLAEGSVRMELLSACWDDCFTRRLPSSLVSVALTLSDRGEGVLRGQVLPLSSPLADGSTVQAFYATIPVYHDEGLATWQGTEPPTVVAWMVPIHSAEANFVVEHGWDAFEELTETRDPDLLDLSRPSIVPR
jgi:hypothetical protein